MNAVKFTRLPKGARFRYQGCEDVWIVVETHGCGLIAKWEGLTLDFIGQQLCCADDSEEKVKELMVIAIDT